MPKSDAKPVVIVDMDGTIADVNHRLHHINSGRKKNWKAFFQHMDKDTPIREVMDQVREMAAEAEIVIVTGRPDQYRRVTEEWLKKHDVPYSRLFMRRAGDHRPDFTVKREILDEIGAERVALAIDDRGPVCEMFRKAGVKVQEVSSDRVNQEANEAYRKSN